MQIQNKNQPTMNHKPEKYGLRKEDTKFIQKICASHSEIEKAILYVLRETGDFALASDLEIALCGQQINKNIIKEIMAVIKKEGTSKVWFDIVHYEALEQNEKDIIDDNGIILYQKNVSEEDEF